jgi:hypothetical protein
MARQRKQSATSVREFKKVPEDSLLALHKAQQAADLAAAEAQNLATQFQLLVARELKKADMLIQSSAICLTCGTMRSIQVPCPECSMAHQGN